MRQARIRLSPERVLFIAAALILLVGTQTPVTSYMSPRSGIGYALGICGGVLLLVQSLYPFHKRLLSFRLLIMLGTVAPLLILIHCGFSLGATNSNIALGAMLLVAVSGLFGRYFYAKTHSCKDGRKATLAELERRAHDIKERGSRLLLLPELAERLFNEERDIQQVAEWTGPGIVFAPFAVAGRHAESRRLLCEYARSAIDNNAARHKVIAAQRDQFEQVTFDYISQRLRATRAIVEFRVYERLFSAWRVVHVPLFLILVAAGIVHVISVHVY
jgi:hypothetical protein